MYEYKFLDRDVADYIRRSRRQFVTRLPEPGRRSGKRRKARKGKKKRGRGKRGKGGKKRKDKRSGNKRGRRGGRTEASDHYATHNLSWRGLKKRLANQTLVDHLKASSTGGGETGSGSASVARDANNLAGGPSSARLSASFLSLTKEGDPLAGGPSRVSAGSSSRSLVGNVFLDVSAADFDRLFAAAKHARDGGSTTPAQADGSQDLAAQGGPVAAPEEPLPTRRARAERRETRALELASERYLERLPMPRPGASLEEILAVRAEAVRLKKAAQSAGAAEARAHYATVRRSLKARRSAAAAGHHRGVGDRRTLTQKDLTAHERAEHEAKLRKLLGNRFVVGREMSLAEAERIAMAQTQVGTTAAGGSGAGGRGRRTRRLRFRPRAGKEAPPNRTDVGRTDFDVEYFKSFASVVPPGKVPGEFFFI